MSKPPKIVSHVQIDLPLANVPLLAQVDFSMPPVLVFLVIVIALPAPDPLSINVQNAPQIVLFSPKDVAYGRVAAKPSSSTIPHHHASLATRVAQAALVLALINVWHVQTLLQFCTMGNVRRRVAPALLWIIWACVLLT